MTKIQVGVGELPEDMRGPERARKARKLEVEARPELGPRVFLVSGHWVNLGDEMVDDCDCADFLYRGGPCKHVLAAQLSEEERDGDSVSEDGGSEEAVDGDPDARQRPGQF